jgi:hypothetical protein
MIIQQNEASCGQLARCEAWPCGFNLPLSKRQEAGMSLILLKRAVISLN